jgi:hypothetical protein
MPHRYVDRFLAIPWDRNARDSLAPTRQNQWNYYQDMASNWLIVGLLLVAAGFVWILQGFNVPFAPKSFMTGDVAWIVLGALAVLGGGALATVSWRRGR